MTSSGLTRQEFEDALPRNKSGHPIWEYNGLVDGEHSYTIQVWLGNTKTSKRIIVLSSIMANMLADQAPAICAIVEYGYKGSWNQLRYKDQETYVEVQISDGWRGRLTEQLRQLYSIGQADERDWYIRNNKPVPTGNRPAPVKRTPVQVKRTPVLQSLDLDTRSVETKAAPALIAAVIASMEFTPSHHQTSIFEWVNGQTRNLVVEALAGSGKTTTIVNALKLVPTYLKVAFVAFTKRIADTLATKAPDWVHVSTLHSLGLGNLMKAYGIKNIKGYINKYKLHNILDGIEESVREIDEAQADVIKVLKSPVRKLVSLFKATMLSVVPENMVYLCERYGIELNGDVDLLFDLVKQVFQRSIDMMDVCIDFDDMIYACAAGLALCKQFDVMFVDECQDLNAAQIAMVLKSAKRIVAVGDRHQSIYGFRGADTDAMPRLIKELNAKTLPLSITYRCPKKHVELIRQQLPHIPIEAAEWAEDGILEDVIYDEMLDQAVSGDLVLCRCNAPLVSPAFALIRRGKKAVILGRDIGDGLIDLMDKISERAKVTSLIDILREMAIYVRLECAKMLDAGRTNMAQLLTDKHETILALSDGCLTRADVDAKIKLVFSNEEAGVVFSSVHKAKGCEADTVYILERQLMPHPNASQEWELEQEWNIWYVAHSRSKHAMYFVH